MEKMQELDHKFNKAKLGFQSEMENDYLQMSDKLFVQCEDLDKEKEYIEKSKKGGQQGNRSFFLALERCGVLT
jgi:hypothetical protein